MRGASPCSNPSFQHCRSSAAKSFLAPSPWKHGQGLFQHLQPLWHPYSINRFSHSNLWLFNHIVGKVAICCSQRIVFSKSRPVDLEWSFHIGFACLSLNEYSQHGYSSSEIDLNIYIHEESILLSPLEEHKT